MHVFILLALASSGAAFASSHEDTLGYSSSDTSFEDECWVDMVTATSDVVLTKAEAYVDENDTSSTPKVYMWYWSRVGTGPWSRATALGGAITVSSSSAAWVSTTTLSVGIDAGTTYAIGYCTTYAIDGYYSTSTAGTLDPVWGTYEGYDWMNSTDLTPATTYTAGRGVYIRLTVTAPDQDRDGFDSIDDCDDTDADVNPDAPEVWYNGQDEDCDGGNDYDQDGDGYDVESHGGDDCDDTDPRVNPSPESRDTWYDGIDSDCSGNSDFDQDLDGDDSSEYGGDAAVDLVVADTDSGAGGIGETKWLEYANTGIGFSSSASDWSLPVGFTAGTFDSLGDGSSSDGIVWGLLNLGQDNVTDVVVAQSDVDPSVGGDHWLISNAECQ